MIKICNMRTAEAEKLLEGVYRDVTFVLANEMAKFCEKVGVDFWVARDVCPTPSLSATYTSLEQV